MNTLINTLQTCMDLGYTITRSRHQVNFLQCVDNTCLLANSPSSCQHLLNMVDNWLQWSGMKAKVTAWLSRDHLACRPVDPKLHLAGDAIPYAANGPVKFACRSMSPTISLTQKKPLPPACSGRESTAKICVSTRLASVHDFHGFSQLKTFQSHG